MNGRFRCPNERRKGIPHLDTYEIRGPGFWRIGCDLCNWFRWEPVSGADPDTNALEASGKTVPLTGEAY